ncbi:MAG TPA: hypothetical protein VEZ71_29225 [Archangium sp.]|nr:hypothetical protein [Archangium sp.]
MRRGTTNGNARGNSTDRARRRAYLLTAYESNKGPGTCRCYRCGKVLDEKTVTVDRVVRGLLWRPVRAEQHPPRVRGVQQRDGRRHPRDKPEGFMNARHRWEETLSQANGNPVERCMHCRTERTPDPGTRSLFLYRRGSAIPPSKKPLGEAWSAFKAGAVPKCIHLEDRT